MSQRKSRAPYTIKGTESSLAAIRLAEEMTQVDFAAYVGVALQTIKRCEKNNTMPQSVAAVRVIERLAEKHDIKL